MRTAFRRSFERDLRRLRDETLRRRIREAIEQVEVAETLQGIPNLRRITLKRLLEANFMIKIVAADFSLRETTSKLPDLVLRFTSRYLPSYFCRDVLAFISVSLDGIQPKKMLSFSCVDSKGFGTPFESLFAEVAYPGSGDPRVMT